MSRWRAALSAALLVGGLQIVPGASLAAASPAAASNSAPAGKPVSAVRISPFGLSVEYPLMEQVLGAGPCPPPSLVSALRILGSPSLRIGGDSQDLAGPTSAYHYAIGLSFWTTLGCLARETGSHLTVGLNFAEAPLADELSTIASAEQAIPASQLSFSLGNEPDLYEVSHILPNEPGFTVPAYRSPSWSASQFASEWDSRRAQLGAQLGSVAIEGPDLAGAKWSETMTQSLVSDPPAVMTVHAYPTVACGTAGAPTTAARLLSKHASVGLVEKYRWLLAAARRARKPAVISESNSASCGGKPGVSDRPVAGVWAARYVVAALLEGFEQVRFHTAGTSYDPLTFATGGAVTVRPLGHALLFLHRWIALGSKVRRSSEDPSVLAATFTLGAHANMIVSSFSSKPKRFTIQVAGTATRLPTATLTSRSALEARSSVAVHDRRVQLVLEPHTVVAIGIG